ncbi:hypothetical protein D3C87_2070860 [compost metagenome]
MVTRLNALFRIGQFGWVRPGEIAHADKYDGFIERGPEFDPVAKPRVTQTRIFIKSIDDLS